MCQDHSAKRCERTKAVHHAANMVVRDRVVCRRTAVVEIPFRRIFKANNERDADWQLLEVERKRLARAARTVAIQSHALISDVGVVDVIGLHLWTSVQVGVAGGRRCGKATLECTRYIHTPRLLTSVQAWHPPMLCDNLMHRFAF